MNRRMFSECLSIFSWVFVKMFLFYQWTEIWGECRNRKLCEEYSWESNSGIYCTRVSHGGGEMDL